VWLEHGGGPALQHVTESPTGEQPFTRCNRNIRRPRDVGHRVDVLGETWLLDEHRRVGFDRIDQLFGKRRRDTAVEVDRDVDVVTDSIPESSKSGRLTPDEGP